MGGIIIGMHDSGKENPMSGPWEKYRKAAPAEQAAGPWTKYQKPQDTARDEKRARIEAARAGTLTAGSARQADIDHDVEQDIRDPGLGLSVMSGLTQGATFGYGDEVAAGLASMLPGGGSYEDSLRTARGLLGDARFSRPVTTTASEIGGAMLVPGAGGAGLVAKAPTLASKAALSAATGAASGGLYGFGVGEGGFDERLGSAQRGAFGGALLGVSMPYAGAATRHWLDNLAEGQAVKGAAKSAPALDDLRQQAGRIYSQADTVTNLPRADFATRATGLIDDAKRAGMDDMLTPGASRVAGKIDEAAQSVVPSIGFRELDILRKQAAIPAGNVQNRTEAAIGSKMIGGIDDFLDAADPKLSASIGEARDMWGKLRRTEMIEEAIARAGNAASGLENGIRIEFRKILNNPKLRRGFSEQEISMMERAARGGPVANVLRQVGRLGVGLSGQSNGLGAAVGGIAGTTIGGPVGGLMTMVAGTGAKALTERSTKKAAQLARDVVAARGNIPAKQGLLEFMNKPAAIAGHGLLPYISQQIGGLIK